MLARHPAACPSTLQTIAPRWEPGIDELEAHEDRLVEVAVQERPADLIRQLHGAQVLEERFVDVRELQDPGLPEVPGEFHAISESVGGPGSMRALFYRE